MIQATEQICDCISGDLKLSYGFMGICIFWYIRLNTQNVTGLQDGIYFVRSLLELSHLTNNVGDLGR